MAVEIGLRVEEQIGPARLLEQGPRIQAALRWNAAREVTSDAVGRLAEETESAAEETRELLREPLQLRGLRMLGGEVPEQNRDALARGEACGDRFRLPAHAPRRELSWHGRLFDFRRRLHHLGER